MPAVGAGGGQALRGRAVGAPSCYLSFTARMAPSVSVVMTIVRPIAVPRSGNVSVAVRLPEPARDVPPRLSARVLMPWGRT